MLAVAILSLGWMMLLFPSSVACVWVAMAFVLLLLGLVYQEQQQLQQVNLSEDIASAVLSGKEHALDSNNNIYSSAHNTISSSGKSSSSLPVYHSSKDIGSTTQSSISQSISRSSSSSSSTSPSKDGSDTNKNKCAQQQPKKKCTNVVNHPFLNKPYHTRI